MRLTIGSAQAWAVWLLGVIVLVWLGTVSSSLGAALEGVEAGSFRAQVAEVAADQSSLRVAPTGAAGRSWRDLAIPAKDEAGKALRARVKSSVHPGDLVVVKVAAVKGQQPALTKLDIETVPVAASQRWLTMAGAALLLLLFVKAALAGNLQRLIVGLDGRTSNSKFQMAVWFGVLMVAYLSTLWLRFCLSGNLVLGAVDVPTNLLALSGLSALSFAGAKAITQGKQNALAAAGMTGAMKQPAGRPAQLADLVQDDAGNADFGDFQMLLVTIIAALTYLVQIFMFLGVLELRGKISLPDADSTLLAAFGLGQGAYLVKKAASGPKPPDVPQGGGAGAGAGGQGAVAGGGGAGVGGAGGAGQAGVAVVAPAPAVAVVAPAPAVAVVPPPAPGGAGGPAAVAGAAPPPVGAGGGAAGAPPAGAGGAGVLGVEA